MPLTYDNTYIVSSYKSSISLMEKYSLAFIKENSLSIVKNLFLSLLILDSINNTLLYVESIYQQQLNEKNAIPLLKKVVVASGNKVAIGDGIKDAINNLLSQEAIKIEVHGDDKNDLIKQIINANNNLKQKKKRNN